jgi:hypothetical protein
MVNSMLSNKFKIPAYVFILTALILSYLYFITNIRIEMPVPALISSFTETRFLTVYTTNVADELILLLFISGFSLLVFSAEKDENIIFSEIRNRALLLTVRIDIGLLVFMTIFIYGGGFMAFIIINIILPFIIYLITFNILKNKALRK